MSSTNSSKKRQGCDNCLFHEICSVTTKKLCTECIFIYKKLLTDCETDNKQAAATEAEVYVEKYENRHCIQCEAFLGRDEIDFRQCNHCGYASYICTSCDILNATQRTQSLCSACKLVDATGRRVCFECCDTVDDQASSTRCNECNGPIAMCAGCLEVSRSKKVKFPECKQCTDAAIKAIRAMPSSFRE